MSQIIDNEPPGPIKQKPPYNDIEVERIARAFVQRRAWGAWINSEEFKHDFQDAIIALGGRGYYDMLCAGAIYAFEYSKKGSRFFDNDRPRLQSLRWLDAGSVRKVLQRARELEALEGNFNKIPAEDELNTLIDAHDRARVGALPGILDRIAAHERGKNGGA